MERKFIFSCESTVDMPYAYINGKRGIEVISYPYFFGKTEYTDNMDRDPKALDEFYRRIADGGMPTTSQLNTYQFTEYFENLLQKGDLLHISIGLGMTGAINNAYAAAKELSAKYPDRRIVVLDSLCSSSGYGMLVDDAADLWDAGKTMDEVIDYVEKNKAFIHHQFFSTDLRFFRRSGRLSGPTAAIATILNVCPIMHVDEHGKLVAYDKVRGKKAAIERTLDVMEAHAVGGKNYADKCFICHSNCLDVAKETEEELRRRFPKTDPKIFNVGTIVASHTGPGTVSVFFKGDARTKVHKA